MAPRQASCGERKTGRKSGIWRGVGYITSPRRRSAASTKTSYRFFGIYRFRSGERERERHRGLFIHVAAEGAVEYVLTHAISMHTLLVSHQKTADAACCSSMVFSFSLSCVRARVNVPRIVKSCIYSIHVAGIFRAFLGLFYRTLPFPRVRYIFLPGIFAFSGTRTV